ncbi:MAG: hypothetical protein QM762_12615 [Chryseolinea sp.]
MSKELEVVLTDLRKKVSVVEFHIAGSPRRRACSVAYTKVQECFMWLGKVKGILGIASPYPKSFDKSSSIIEPRADMGTMSAYEGWINPSSSTKREAEISNTKLLRLVLHDIETELRSLSEYNPENKMFQLAVQNAYTYCAEATMWLGMVLNEIFREDRVLSPVTPLPPPHDVSGTGTDEVKPVTEGSGSNPNESETVTTSQEGADNGE